MSIETNKQKHIDMKTLNKKQPTIINSKVVVSWIVKDGTRFEEGGKWFVELTDSEIRFVKTDILLGLKNGCFFSKDRTEGTKIEWELV